LPSAKAKRQTNGKDNSNTDRNALCKYQEEKAAIARFSTTAQDLSRVKGKN
jgi:hypothetical protein